VTATLITMDQARGQCRSDPTDPVDDAQVALAASGAEQRARDYLDRAVFTTQEELDAAIAMVPAQLMQAEADFNTATAAASAWQGVAWDMAKKAAWDKFKAAQSQAEKIYAGIVVDDAIVAGILLLVGHLYANREAVLIGPTAAAIEMPQGALDFLSPKRRVGV